MQAVEQSLFELSPGEPVRLRLLDQYLVEQQELSAVERFAQRHDADAVPNSDIYRDLIPLVAPSTGQQYAFHVDLDECTGCKACVSACHNLNGLDDHETWRSVGLLHGGSAREPMQQTVTTACHHCVSPACLSGCPVRAYDKDPVTGIVRHLDDQCIGCQYCVFTCPYEVPQFNARKGIVRKCDMCSDRLANAEAPACVQACPNEAISIRLVDQKQVIEDSQADQFLPAAPSPGITIPTTTYATTRSFPRNLLPADFYALRVNHEHLPLVIMLVFTQLSVGAFWAELLIERLIGRNPSAAPYHALFALMIGLFALGGSVLHLGRPLYAFRAILGVRSSWLSREILAFGAFAGAAVLYAATNWHVRIAVLLGVPALSVERADALLDLIGPLVATTGAVGVLCSVMVYHATRRTYWSAVRTGPKFFLSAAVLGAGSALLSAIVTVHGSRSITPVQASVVSGCALLVIGLGAFKLAFEAGIFLNLRDKRHGDLKRAALLMRGDLRSVTLLRFACGVCGTIAFPLVLATAAGPNLAEPWAIAIAALALLSATAGEICERRLFFSAMSAPRMPGGLR